MRSPMPYVLLALTLNLFAGGCNNAETGSPDSLTTADTAADSLDHQTNGATNKAEPEQAFGVGEMPLSDDDPEAVVREYLNAHRTGDPTTVNRLLTALAQRKIQELDIALSPPVTEAAEFEILGHKYLDAERNLSHVGSLWKDRDSSGEMEEFSIVWVVRLESEGWRIAGMIPQATAGAAPPAINFEDPLGTIRRLEAANEAYIRDSGTTDSDQTVRPAQFAEPADGPSPVAR